jgi:hypothetical protein
MHNIQTALWALQVSWAMVNVLVQGITLKIVDGTVEITKNSMQNSIKVSQLHCGLSIVMVEIITLKSANGTVAIVTNSMQIIQTALWPIQVALAMVLVSGGYYNKEECR